MRIKKNGVPFNYYPLDTLPHKKRGCMGCEYRGSKECGRIEAERDNDGMMYKKVIDARCKHENS